MRLIIRRGGALTSVQDLGRWGHQDIGMPVSGAMDAPALVRGNILLGNEPGAAALEMAMMGPTIEFREGDGVVAIVGADLSPKLNGQSIPNWTAIPVRSGDVLSFGGPCGRGQWAYICVSGGVDVPPVMGSRSTYMKAKIGGLDGRKLEASDELPVGTPWAMWRHLGGIACPEELRPSYAPAPLRTVLGPQDDLITPKGRETFLSSEYVISASSDRMGCRMEGEATVEHVEGPDIVSDAIPMGAVQIPGQGLPIVMMADRQTTGGYVKIGVVHSLDVARLAQLAPGSRVRFAPITQEQGIEISKAEGKAIEALGDHVRDAASRAARASLSHDTSARAGAMTVTVDGRPFHVTWERIS